VPYEFSSDTYAPVWRFYNVRNGSRFYTASDAGRDYVKAHFVAGQAVFPGLACLASAGRSRCRRADAVQASRRDTLSLYWAL